MKYFVILLTALLGISFNMYSQTGEDSVKAAVQQLFKGMQSADANMVRNAFADSAILQTIARTKEGMMTVKTESLENFATSIGKLEKGAADERIEFETIRIDGPMAMVWTPYRFYFNGKFSHCGVNSFLLVKIQETWKIQYIIDTRRRQGCE